MSPRKTTKPAAGRTQRKILKPRKPVFSAGTWISLLLLVLLIGAAFYLNRQAAEDTEDTEATPAAGLTFIFDEDRIVTSIEIKPASGETVRMERNEEKLWVLTKPFEIEADPTLVEAAAFQVNSLSIVSEIEDADPGIFGLDAPQYTITIEFEDGSTGTLEIGDATPINSGYYVRLDGQKIMITTLSGIDALTTLANFPPYLNTPTPTATATLPPTETPVPASPQSDATPTP